MLFSADLTQRLCRTLSLRGPIRIVDVGASDLSQTERPSYEPLLQHGIGHLTAFEPNPAELAKLVPAPDRQYLSHAVGDGKEVVFNVTAHPGLCSTLTPDRRMLAELQTLGGAARILSQTPMRTSRLDDIAEVGPIDFLKIDAQGGELSVFEGGRLRLADVLCVQTEVGFVSLYEDQPTFGQQDAMLQSLGLRFYAMKSVNRFPLAATPQRLRSKWRSHDIGQWVDGDAIYLRDLLTWGALPVDRLTRLFFILAFCLPAIGATLAVAQRLVGLHALPEELYLRLEAELEA